MIGLVRRAALRPFRENPKARRLALIFAVVYFAQGTWYLPNLSITFLLKDTFGLSAAQTAAFFSITVIPWLIKPTSDSSALSNAWERCGITTVVATLIQVISLTALLTEKQSADH